MVSKIHFIRHGITEGNIKMWFYGGLDLPLAEEGKAALRRLKAENIYPTLTEDADCYTTGLIRTEETFEIIFGAREHRVLEDFREMCFGKYERMSYEELKNVPEFKTWVEDVTGDVRLPEGETGNEFRARVSRGLSRLLSRQRMKENEGKKTGRDAVSVVVCHGGVIGAVMAEMFPKEEKNFLTWIPKPGFGYTVTFEEGEPVSYEEIGECPGGRK